nr:hypothetical protein CFP56_44501 [Quercus suber]
MGINTVRLYICHHQIVGTGSDCNWRRGLFRRQKFLEERMAGHRHLICCSASSLLCNKIFLKICCISLSSTKLE